jgi:LuxR family maltose regulon positive regulatory protein
VENLNFKEKINKYVKNNNFNSAVTLLENSYELIFSYHNLENIYASVSEIDYSYFESNKSKLLLGWMAFLCGDNIQVEEVMISFDDIKFNNAEESSLFYSLKSMIVFSKSSNEGLKYSKLSVDLIKDSKNSFIKANAYLTYGRQLTSKREYRKGAECFEKAQKLFKKTKSNFLIFNSLVSKCLNLHSLGEFDDAINKAIRAVKFSSSRNTEPTLYANLAYLPVGMCYYELNKLSLAKTNLEKSKKALESLGIVNLHGILELYLFKIFYTLNDDKNMEGIIEFLEGIFKNIQFSEIKLLITCLKIKYNFKSNKSIPSQWVEELEMAYQMNGLKLPFFILEVLIELRLKNLSLELSDDKLIELLDTVRYEGNIPDKQSLLLYLSELYFNKNNKDKSLTYLKWAHEIYKEYGILSNFYKDNLKCLNLIEDLDRDLYINLKNFFNKTDDNMNTFFVEDLTERELEILKIISSGKSNKEISNLLYITLGTTKWHISNIFGKLQVKNRTQAVEKAKKLNLI